MKPGGFFLVGGAVAGTLALLAFAATNARTSASPPLPPPTPPPLLWPVPGFTRISSGYGPRIDPVTKKSHVHRGIDIPVPIGTPILAPAAGLIERIDLDCGDQAHCPNGNAIFLLADPYLFCFLHLSAFQVAKGQTVRRGEVLGLSGSTGRSTGPHLHLQIYLAGHSGGTIDPLELHYG